jgi:hypothetical protein
LFDRVSQIEDADRGVNPPGVTAASAIAYLQERGAVLIRQKIRAVDHLVREIARHWTSLTCNFSVDYRKIQTGDESSFLFRPYDFLGTDFDVIVESGSTVAKSQIVLEQQALQLFGVGVVDRRYLLEVLRVPKFEQLLERMADKQSDQIIQAMLEAGYPPGGGDLGGIELPPILLIKEVLELKTKGGPTPTPQGEGQPQPGTVIPDSNAQPMEVPQ